MARSPKCGKMRTPLVCCNNSALSPCQGKPVSDLSRIGTSYPNKLSFFCQFPSSLSISYTHFRERKQYRKEQLVCQQKKIRRSHAVFMKRSLAREISLLSTRFAMRTGPTTIRAIPREHGRVVRRVLDNSLISTAQLSPTSSSRMRIRLPKGI